MFEVNIKTNWNHLKSHSRLSLILSGRRHQFCTDVEITCPTSVLKIKKKKKVSFLEDDQLL